MPQDAMRMNPRATLTFGNTSNDPARQHPALALKALSVIAQWSNLEGFLDQLHAQFRPGGGIDAARAFSDLRTTDKRIGAVMTLAEASPSLEPADVRVIRAVLKLYKRAGAERNKIAHWRWGYSPSFPGAVLLCDPREVILHSASMRAWQEGVMRRDGTSDPPPFPRKAAYVYREQDFDALVASTERLMSHFAQLTVCVATGRGHGRASERAVAALNRLAAQPEIAQVIENERQRAARRGSA